MRGRNYCWVFLFLIFSGYANASTVTYWDSTLTTTRHSGYETACGDYGLPPAGYGWYWIFKNVNGRPAVDCYHRRSSPLHQIFVGQVTQLSETCEFGNTGTQCNSSCPAPSSMVDGQCVAAPPVTCPVGQKPNASNVCEAFTCTQDSSGDEIVYSPKQAKCNKHYNLDLEEQCNYMGQKKTPTTQPLSLITNDPDGLAQGVDNFKCGIDVATKDCATKNDGTHRCIVTGTSNGTYYPNATDNNVPNCPTQDCTTKPPETPKPEVPKPETSTDSKPCNYASVNGALECVSSSIENKEGTKNCGTFNGAWQCVKVPPTSNGISILTKVTTEATPDGGTKTTKTDTATQTKCSDIGKCTTSTTTNVNVTIKDGQGNTTSTTGTCKGDNCPDKNGNPDANGDGFGDCVGDDCGEDEETKVGAQDWYQEGEDSYASVLGDFADRVANIPVVAGVDNFLSVTPTGACPVWQVDAWVFHIRLDQFCQGEIPWDLIRAIVIGCFAFLAFRIAFL